MKNLFTAILIAVVSTSVFAAEYYVYDYKASIKRLDYILTTKKVTKVDTVIQKYKGRLVRPRWRQALRQVWYPLCCP